MAAHLCAILNCDAMKIDEDRDQPGGLIEYALSCTVLLGSGSSIHSLKLKKCCVFVWVGVRVCAGVGVSENKLIYTKETLQFRCI